MNPIKKKIFRNLEVFAEFIKGAKITNIEPVRLLIKNLG